jgi:hypothetical protein
MAPFLDSLPEPLMHGPAPMPHAMLQGAFDGLYPAGDQWYWRADFVKEIPDEAVAIHHKYGSAAPTWKSTMHMYPIDGAAHDVDSADTAWFYRDANWGSVFAGVDPDPANVDAIRRWSIDYFGSYIRFVRRRVCEHDDGGGAGARARQLREELRPAGVCQGDLRPRQRLPGQPEHPAEGMTGG